jgi:signal peptidase I
MVNVRSAAAYQRAAHDAIAAANSIEPLRLIVISDSMWPLLRAGDAVRVQPIGPVAIHVGDVIVVRRNAELITHRVIDIDGEQWITRGDNAVFADAPVLSAACVGRVTPIERGAHPIDLAQPQWTRLNHRLGQIGRVHWRINRWLRLTPASASLSIRSAWLIALPFRALIHLLVMRSLSQETWRS